MFAWIKKQFLNKYAKSLTRHLITAIGMWLVTQGFSEEAVAQWAGPTTEIVTGLLLMAIAQLSSWLDKKRNQDEE